MRHSKPALVRSALVRSVACLLGAALVLTGCTASPPDAGATESAESVNTADWPAVELNTVGPVEKMIDVPEGAASFRVSFACVGGNFSLTVGGAMQNDRRGGCQGTRTYLLPVSKSTLMQLYIFVPDDSHFVLTGEFTTDVFTPDPQITDQCEQLSDFTSRYLNAEQGFSRGDVTAAEWRTEMDGAVEVITELQKTATGLIGLEVPALVEGISAPVVVPGYFLEQREATAMDVAGTIVSDVCSDNGSGMTIMAKYGG
ncbi:hypothetical protein [Cryobacterium sp. AP23]